MGNDSRGDAGGHEENTGASGDREGAVERPKHEPEDHRIRQRAYEIWIEEGQPDGRDVDHWLRAKWELEREPILAAGASPDRKG
jgi:hypothetical protein